MRNRMSSSSCASLFHLNKSLSDSLIKVAGRHRSMKLINQQFPGTPIVVPLNAEVEVLVRNKMMVEAVSIHWHGQTQKGSFYPYLCIIKMV
jgi:FtsP/CotA-like multicopper oxidase with cupredoxin domain